MNYVKFTALAVAAITTLFTFGQQSASAQGWQTYESKLNYAVSLSRQVDQIAAQFPSQESAFLSGMSSNNMMVRQQAKNRGLEYLKAWWWASYRAEQALVDARNAFWQGIRYNGYFAGWEGHDSNLRNAIAGQRTNRGSIDNMYRTVVQNYF